MRVVFLAAVLGANLALAQPAEQAKSPIQWGVMLDAGVPSGAGLSVAFRPLSLLRIQAGPNYNVLGFGAHAGVSLIPFSAVISPSLNVEVGRFFTNDITGLAGSAISGANLDKAGDALRHVAYNYGTAELGLELGPPRSFSAFIHVGVSYIQATVNGAQTAIQNATGDTSLEVQPIKVKAVAPSARVGFIVYF